MTFAEAAANADLGRAHALKRGRNPKWPYVPTIITSYEGTSQTTESQILGKAFKTRQEAVDWAAHHIARLRAKLEADLALPGSRALREHYGLPRELA